MRIVFPFSGRQTKEPMSKLYKQCSWQPKHKEEVSLFRNFQIDCLENQISPKNNSDNMTHEPSANKI